METTLAIASSAILLQLVDALSIITLSEKARERSTLTIISGRILNRRRLFVGLKLGFGITTVILYYGMLQATETLDLWLYFGLVRDAYVGGTIFALVLTSGTRFFLAKHKTPPQPNESKPLPYEVSFLIFVLYVTAILGILFLIFFRSFLLLGSAVMLFMTYLQVKPKKEDREDKQPKKEQVSKSKKTFLIVLVLITSSLVILLTNSSSDVWVPSDLESNSVLSTSSQLKVHSTGLTFEGVVEDVPADIPESTFSWFSSRRGAMEGFVLRPSSGNRTVAVYGESGSSLGRTYVQSILLTYFSQGNCTKFYSYRVDYRVRVVSENTTAILSIDKSYGINVSFDFVREPNRAVADMYGVLGEDSSIQLVCRYPVLVLDGVERSFNGTVTIQIEGPQEVELSTGLDEDTFMWIRGTSSFEFPEGRMRVDDIEDTMISSRGAYERMRGQLYVLESESLQLTFKSEDFSWRSPEPVVPFELRVNGGISYALTEQSGYALLPATHSVYLIEPEAIRLAVFGLIVVVSFCFVMRVYLLPGKEEDSKDGRDDSAEESDESRVKIAALFMGAFIVVLGAQYSIGGAPVGYYLSHTPMNIEIWMEQGVDVEFVEGVMEIFLFEMSELFHISDISLEYHHIPSDGIVEYYPSDLETWGPAGQRGHDTLLMAAGHGGTLHVNFLKGSSKVFIGINNYGATITILLEGDEYPFEVLRTLTHEFGHALGLQHNQASRMMTGDRSETWPVYPKSVTISDDHEYRGTYLFGDAKNGSVQGFADWGNQVFKLVDRQREGNPNSTFNAYVFLNNETNSLRQVVYSSHLTPDGIFMESVFIYYAPADWLFWSFSLSERVYILNSVADGDAPAISDRWSS